MRGFDCQRHERLIGVTVTEQRDEYLPFDIGREAYIARMTPDLNPYKENDWRHEEWWKGWSHEEECDRDESWDWSANKFKLV